MRSILRHALAVSLALGLSSVAQAAIIVENTNFIATPTAFNGFESLGSTTNYPSHTVYSEGGINVEYIGTANIWSTYTPSIGGQGHYGWYENGGGVGFTKITMANNSDFQNIQFLAGDGNAGADIVAYQLLENGVVVASGTTVDHNSPMAYVGFSGSGFNEIDIQGLIPGFGATSFGTANHDALAIDSIAVNQTNVPEPGMLALLGIGLLGFFARRKTA